MTDIDTHNAQVAEIAKTLQVSTTHRAPFCVNSAMRGTFYVYRTTDKALIAFSDTIPVGWIEPGANINERIRGRAARAILRGLATVQEAT